MEKNKCFIIGCNEKPVNSVIKLYGDKAIFCTCKAHTPSKNNRPESLKNLPFFYKVQPLNNTK